MIHPKLKAIEQCLRETFHPSTLEVYDESYRHQGHVGFIENDVTHVKITLKAPCLSSLTPLEQHRKIYASLKTLDFNLHAVSLRIG